MSMKRMLIIISCLILLVACSTDSVQESDYEKLEYVIEMEAEYTFNIYENKRKILELEKKISELK